MQEEDKIKQEKSESAHLTIASKDKGKKRKESKEAASSSSAQKKQKQEQAEQFSCYFCKGAGHRKSDCTKYHAWRVKKGLPELSKVK